MSMRDVSVKEMTSMVTSRILEGSGKEAEDDEEMVRIFDGRR